MKKKQILLIGGGGHCHSVIDVIEQEDIYQIVGILDANKSIGEMVLGYEIIGSDKDLEKFFKEYAYAFIAIGHIRSNTSRVELFHKLKSIGYEIPTIVSPLAYLSRHATIHEGSIIMHHALVNANAVISENCIINTKALIEHDAIIEEHVHISTGAIINGGVRVKKNSFIGSNATVKEGVEVDDFVKAGSLYI